MVEAFDFEEQMLEKVTEVMGVLDQLGGNNAAKALVTMTAAVNYCRRVKAGSVYDLSVLEMARAILDSKGKKSKKK